MKRVNEARRCRWIIQKIIGACEVYCLTVRLQGSKPSYPFAFQAGSGLPLFLEQSIYGRDRSCVETLKPYLPWLTVNHVWRANVYYREKRRLGKWVPLKRRDASGQ